MGVRRRVSHTLETMHTENQIQNQIESPHIAKGWLYTFAGFMLFYSALLLFSLGYHLPFIGPDEPRYAEVAREMFVSGDYVSPRLCGLLWFEKPVLFYWLAAGAYHLFGVNEFAARLPSALAAMLAVGFFCYACWRAHLLRLGLLSSVILATSGIWMGFSHGATTDMLLTSAICIALLAAFLTSLTDGKTRLGFLMLCAVATGVAMLAKGLIGVLLVALILVIHGLLTRRFVFRRWTELVIAAFVFLAVISLWYLPVTLRHGETFINEFFVNHHFKRYLTNKYQHAQPAYFYLFIVFAGALPWGFFLLSAVRHLRSLRPRASDRDSLLTLAWIWLVVPVAFFSFSTSKLPGYILPAFPGLAIILGAEAERFWNGDRSRLLRGMALLNALSLVLLIVGAEAYLHKKGFSMQGWEFAAYGVPLAFGIVVCGAILLGKVRVAVLGPAVAMLTVSAVATFCLFPQAGTLLSAKSFSIQVASSLKPQEDIVFYRKEKEYAPVFYSGGRVVFYHQGRAIQNMSSGDDLDIKNCDELAAALRNELWEGESSVVLVTSPKWQDELKDDPRFGSATIAQEDKSVAVRVWLKPHDG